MSNPNQDKYQRYHLNADGPFYVKDGECLSCMMPAEMAPELMGYDEKQAHCYFKKQPCTPAEVDHAILAILTSDIEGLRYAGDDPDIIARLKGYVCDCARETGPCSEWPRSLGMLEHRALEKPQPDEPAVGLKGEVMVEVVVGQEGLVESVRVITGPPGLQPMAVEAAYRARFEPEEHEGKAIKFQGLLTYVF